MNIDQILIRPLLTEKGTTLTQTGVYSFEVHADANKFQIRETVEKLYKVEVDKIRVVTRKGKMKKAGRKMVYKAMPDRKLAYIKLRSGKIDLFPEA